MSPLQSPYSRVAIAARCPYSSALPFPAAGSAFVFFEMGVGSLNKPRLIIVASLTTSFIVVLVKLLST